MLLHVDSLFMPPGHLAWQPSWILVPQGRLS